MFKTLVVAGGSALLSALLIGPVTIKYLKKLKVGATIQEELNETHQAKAGTPLMGGLIFVIPLSIITLILAVSGLIEWRLALGFLVFTLGYGTIGFIDDYLKVVKRHADGLNIKDKLIGQSMIFILYLLLFSYQPLNTNLMIPFTNCQIALGYAYIPFIFVLALGTTNAVNFTDGMDGLLAGCMIASSIAYGAISLFAGSDSLAIVSAVIIGGLLGYLRFNYHPAQVFMGDTGSLALGGALTALAIFTKTELLLVIIGGIYVVETISVIIQIVYFRLNGGKRFFLMAPIHHHYQEKNIAELRIVWTFWGISAICGLIGVLGYLTTGFNRVLGG